MVEGYMVYKSMYFNEYFTQVVGDINVPLI